MKRFEKTLLMNVLASGSIIVAFAFEACAILFLRWYMRDLDGYPLN